MRVFSSPPDASHASSITGVSDEVSRADGLPLRALQLQRAIDEAQVRVRDAAASADPFRMALALRELGVAELAAGASDLAVATLERADQEFSALQPSSEHVRLLLTLASAYESVERFRDALTAFKRFHDLEASIDQRGRDEWRRAEAAEAQLYKTRNELTLALRRQAELSDINAHLLRMERQKTELLQQAERFSLEDSVTQVNNRRCLDVRLAADVQRARRYASPLTIAMVDIDNFKEINDRYAHTKGDEVLRRVAALMRESLRDSDYVARYGGDEFVLVFPETRLSNARLVCEMVRERIAAEDWSSIAPELKITVSLGVAERSPNTNTPDLLLNAADRLLYRAKRHGKNAVAPSSSRSQDKTPARQS
jgi:diguanylate cyclase (GGDEF)-like protein